MKYYKISEKRLRELLRAELEIMALHWGQVSIKWPEYEQSIINFIEEWKDNSKDIINTWDDDDPRHECMWLDEIVSIDIRQYKKSEEDK